jgi:hypothetical protein
LDSRHFDFRLIARATANDAAERLQAGEDFLEAGILRDFPLVQMQS